MPHLIKTDLRTLFTGHSTYDRLAERAQTLEDGDDQLIYDFVTGLHGQTLRRMPMGLRYDLIEKLGPISQHTSGQARRRRDLAATILLVTQPYPVRCEEFENEWLDRLLKSRIARAVFGGRSVVLFAESLQVQDARNIVQDFVGNQASIFRQLRGIRWISPAETITIFHQGITEAKALAKPGQKARIVQALYEFDPLKDGRHPRYPDLRSLTGRTMAFNFHEDAGPFAIRHILRRAAHEEVHDITLQMLFNVDGKALTPSDNPYDRITPAIHREQIMENFLADNFGRSVYRAQMTERSAFSLSDKFFIRLLGNAAPTEFQLLAHDVLSELTEGDRWVVNCKIAEAATGTRHANDFKAVL